MFGVGRIQFLNTKYENVVHPYKILMCNIFDGCFNLFLLICVELTRVSSLPADDRMNPLQKLTEF